MVPDSTVEIHYAVLTFTAHAVRTLAAQQTLHLFVDFISNCANGIKRLPLRIRQRPIDDSQARHKGASFPTAHCDQHRSTASEFVSELLRPGSGKVYTDFPHHFY